MSTSDAARISAYAERVNREIVRGQADANAHAAVKPDDEALLLRLQSSDMEAFSLLFHRYSQLVLGIARRVLQNKDEAEDLIQDIFLFLFYKCKLFDPAKGTARSWIMQVTYHRAFDRRRYLKARSFYDLHSERSADGNALPPSSGDNLEDFIAWRSCLQPAFEQLSDEQRKTLRLHFYYGYTIREISELLGQPVGNVQHYFYRGLDRLRKHVFHHE